MRLALCSMYVHAEDRLRARQLRGFETQLPVTEAVSYCKAQLPLRWTACFRGAFLLLHKPVPAVAAVRQLNLVVVKLPARVPVDSPTG